LPALVPTSLGHRRRPHQKTWCNSRSS